MKNNMLIRKALENLGISSLNDMQQESLETGKLTKDLILLAPTGSGKTLSYLLPVLELLNKDKSGIQALIIVPSRELALQIEQVFRSMSTGFKVNCFYGGHLMKTERNNLKQPPELLIGTPGRIADHLRRNNFDSDSIEVLVLDEFDKALELGFQNEISYIVGQLKKLKKKILTSATHDPDIPAFIGLNAPVLVNYLDTGLPPKITIRAVHSTGKDKLDALLRLTSKIAGEPTLLFCNHREAVSRISSLLFEKGLPHDIFHGGMEQADRERALIKFRNGSHTLLITTDLASRGLDIPEIKHVIHYQLPTTEKAFIHRNGRTARMSAEGTAYLILAGDEHIPPFLDEEPLEETIPDVFTLPVAPKWCTLFFSGGKKDKISKTDIAGLLLQKGGLLKEDLGLITVLDHSAYVAVDRSKIDRALKLIRNEPVKRKKLRIDISK